MPRKLFVWKMECVSCFQQRDGQGFVGSNPNETPAHQHMECKVPNEKEIGINVADL